MGDTTRGGTLAADPDEAAFQRLAEGLAALRRDAERVREPVSGMAAPSVDTQTLAATLADIHGRIDALASRVGAVGDSTPILAALRTVEEKIGSLSAALDRFAESGPVTEALEKANAKIDALAARLDARLNRLQENQGALGAKMQAARTPAAAAFPAAAEPAARAPIPHAIEPLGARVAVARTPAIAAGPEPGPRRSHLPALLLLAGMVIAAAGVLAWMRPDLIKPDWVRREWVDPAHDAVSRWLRLSRSQPSAPADQVAAVRSVPVQAPASAPAPAEAASPASPPGAPNGGPDGGPDGGPQGAKTADAAPAAREPPSAAAPSILPPSRPAASAPLDPPASASASSPASAEPPAAAPRIVLGASADVWLMVRDAGGHALLARILHPGETWPVPDQSGLRLSTGNAGATIVTINGVAAPSLGGSGTVRRDVSLDAGVLAIGLAPEHKPRHQPHSPGVRSVNEDHSPSSTTASR